MYRLFICHAMWWFWGGQDPLRGTLELWKEWALEIEAFLGPEMATSEAQKSYFSLLLLLLPLFSFLIASLPFLCMPLFVFFAFLYLLLVILLPFFFYLYSEYIQSLSPWRLNIFVSWVCGLAVDMENPLNIPAIYFSQRECPSLQKEENKTKTGCLKKTKMIKISHCVCVSW